jgi:enhancing lycopene biosynthesis protein 2
MLSAMNTAVVLAGCGRGDGTEITEAVSVLVHCARLGMRARCFAPNQPSVDTIDHATGKADQGTRNLMVEAARIARGDIAPLETLDAHDFDALLFPGGFGAAKNLCDFASKGPQCDVHPQVRRVVGAFAAASKPMGFICIAPVIAARLLPGCELTIGTDAATASALHAMGATHVPKGVTECHVDERALVVSTPAYMHDANPWEVFTGIGKLVEEVARLGRMRGPSGT